MPILPLGATSCQSYQIAPSERAYKNAAIDHGNANLDDLWNEISQLRGMAV
jgi:hypothetical protein